VSAAKHYHLLPGYTNKPWGENTENWKIASLPYAEKALGAEKFGRR